MTHDLVGGRSQERIQRGKQVDVESVWKLLLCSWVCVSHLDSLGLMLAVCPQCPGGTFTPSMKSTKDYPDEVINFMRSHPLMYQAVYPLQRRPLVVRTGAPYRLTTVAVDQVDAADGRYEVLFLGTGTHCCSQTLPHWAHWMGGTDPGARFCPARGCFKLIYGNLLSLTRIASKVGTPGT